MDNVDTDL